MGGQEHQILALLKRRSSRGITSWDALSEIGCMRLAARIYDLRCAGHDIQTRMEDTGSTKIARYVLRTIR